MQPATKHTIKHSIAAAVFGHVSQVEQAIDLLQHAGFTKDQISVICSEAVQKQVFGDYQPEETGSTSSEIGPLEGGLIGAALGGVASVAVIVTSGGLALAAIGPVLLGGLTGTLLGLLVGSGVEDEQARFYEQSVSKGDVLITVGAPHGLTEEDLILAERTLADAGARPIELLEG